jgi:hypothetical protein
MCVTCVSTAGQTASWGAPALAAGAAAVLTGVRSRFPARVRHDETAASPEPVAAPPAPMGGAPRLRTPDLGG